MLELCQSEAEVHVKAICNREASFRKWQQTQSTRGTIVGYPLEMTGLSVADEATK